MAVPEATTRATVPRLTLHLGDQPAIEFVDPPRAVRAWLTREHGPILEPGCAVAAPLTATFAPLAPTEGSVLLAIDSIKTASMPEGRFLLVDHAGRAAQLPRTGTESTVACDPDFDRQLWGPFHTWIERLIDWQAVGRGMATLKGAAVSLPEGNVAIAAFQGSGKTSTVLALLQRASGYLGEDRLTIGETDSRTHAMAFPAPLRLSRGRDYALPDAVARRAFGSLDRRLLSLAPKLPARVASHLASRWISLDVATAFPAVEFPRSVALDAIVFLQPHRGPMITMPLDGERSVELATQVARFHHDRYLAPFHQLHASLFLDDPEWPVVPPTADRLRSLLAELPGFLIRVPAGGPAGAVADAVRDVLHG